MRSTIKGVVALCCAAVALSACRREEGPAERAGREADQAMQESAHEMGEAMQKAGEQMGQATQQMGNSLEDAIKVKPTPTS